MPYTTFGRRTGLRISQYALVTGNFVTGWDVGAEPGGNLSTPRTGITPGSPRSRSGSSFTPNGTILSLPRSLWREQSEESLQLGRAQLATAGYRLPRCALGALSGRADPE